MLKAFTLCTLFLLLFTISVFSFASEVTIEKQKYISIQPYVSWYFDSSGDIDIQTITNVKDRFVASPNKVNFERTNGAHWLQFDIRLPNSITQKKWLLKLSYTQLDRIDLYSQNGTSAFQHQVLGDSLPVSQQKSFHPDPVFHLTLENGQTTRIYMRIQSSTSINVPLTLWQSEYFNKYERKNLLVGGIIYGVFIGLLFYNLFLYTTVRSPAYLWFALYLFSFSLFQFSIEGYARLYFWPEWPALADRAVTFSLWISMASGLRFTQHIAFSRQYSPRLDQLFSILVIFAFFIAAIILFTGPAITFPLLAPFGVMVALLIPIPLFLATKAGYKPARFALLAFLPVFPGALLLAARSLALVEPSFWSEHLFPVGAAISAVLLSFALADRINFLREEKILIQSQLLKTERDAHVARKNFSDQLIQTQDEERRRLASELHDSVGQNLSFLSNALKKLEKENDNKTLKNASQITRETVNEIRFISHQLHPHILDQLGLIAAIESICEHIEDQTQIRCNVNAMCEPCDLDSATQLHIYRIVQESLNNVVKHSQASHIEVNLNQEGQSIILSIVDNGCGLTESPSTGLGLESIRHRVTLIKGNLAFKNNKPHGLIVLITIPIQESA